MSSAPADILGIHHATAIVTEPQPCIDFYTQTLGLRVVKLTVNHDDPGSYHLYFGDRTGRPGTAITFFAWPGAPPAQPGRGQVLATAYAISPDAYGYWTDRLAQHDITFTQSERFGQRVIALRDPDQLQVELIAEEQPLDVQPWEQSTVPEAQAIRGFHSVTLAPLRHAASVAMLTDVFGFRALDAQQNRHRFETGPGGSSATVDLLDAPDLPRGTMGPGTVHHVAWRVADDEQHRAWRERLIEHHYNVTPMIDRYYFHSIYFREPGGVIFEMATDGPGFMVDEPIDRLAGSLVLPPHLEAQRAAIEQGLPPVRVPGQQA